MNIRRDIFVSSTFQDMHAERDLLHKVVIPELMERFSKYRMRLDLIDLRWGINTKDESSEQENTNKILRVCFDEIDRSRPFFICFIGERYGWIPDKNIIESSLLGYDLKLDRTDPRVSITELEIQYALNTFDADERTFFFIRKGISPFDISDAATREIYFPADEESKQRCTSLKNYLYENHRQKVFEYNCYWDRENNCVSGLGQLQKLLTDNLGEQIASHLSQSELQKSENSFAAENALQKAVLFDIQSNVYGRVRELDRLEQFVKSSASKELVVISPSGFGKSSLMAAFIKRLSQSHPDTLVIPYFAGLSERSRNFRFLTQYCYAQLQPDDADNIPLMEYSELKKRFYSALMDASETRNVVFVVDALDQFCESEECSRLDWLHDQLIPERVKIIYSCLPGREDVFKKRSADMYNLDALELEDIPTVASGIAERLHKELSFSALSLLCKKTDKNGFAVCRVPIYLASLLELLCSFDANDYAKINAASRNQHLSPIMAIEEYISQTLRSVGDSIRHIIEAVSEKTASQLGEKFSVITALLVSAKKGITEKEMLGITAGTPYSVTGADFSLYRRMFRMHLQEREDGCWCFTHNIICDAMMEKVEGADHASLWERAVSYYLGLDENDPEKYPGLIHAAYRCNNLSVIAESCFAPCFIDGVAELYSGMELSLNEGASDIWLLDVCSEEQCFEICRVLANHIGEQSVFTPQRVLEVCVLCISSMHKYNFKARRYAAVLSQYYRIAGIILLRSADSRCHSFFEICLRLLEEAADPASIVRTALEISDLFADRQEWNHAKKYAKTAYSYAKRFRFARGSREDQRLMALCRFSMGRCAMLHPLQLSKTRAAVHLYHSAKLADKCEDCDLMVRSAVMYLRTPLLLRKKQHFEFINEHLGNISVDDIDGYSCVELLLYRAQQSNDIQLYSQTYQAAIRHLAGENSAQAMMLYEKAAECYGYQLMLKDGADPFEVIDVMSKACRICTKLDMATNDIQWNEKRLFMANDLSIYCRSHSKEDPASETVRVAEERVRKELKKKSVGILQKKSSFLSATFAIGMWVLIAFVAISVGFLILNPSDGEWMPAQAIPGLLYNLFEVVLNVLAVLAMTVLAIMLQNTDKTSYDHHVNSKLLSRCIIAICALMSICFFLFMLGFSDLTLPYHFDRYIYPTLYTFFLSIMFSCSITWFIALVIAGSVRRSKAFADRSAFCFVYRRRQWWKTQILSIAPVAIFALCFIPCIWIGKMDHSYNFITFTGMKAKEYLPYCWIPPAVQIIVSVTGYLIMLHRTKKKCVSEFKVPAKFHKKPLITLCVCAVLVVVTGISVSQIGKELQFKKHGYRVHDGMLYEVSSDGATVYGYIGEDNAVRIPGRLYGKTVTEITGDAFAGSEITYVSIPSGVTCIRESSFEKCLHLEKVKLHNKLTVIEDFAFLDCISLKEISFGKRLISVGRSAFGRCRSLEKVKASKDAEIEFGTDCFESSGLEFSPEAMEMGFFAIGKSIVCSYTGYHGRLTIPEGVTHIPDNLFANCRRITELILPESLTVIGKSAFKNCSSLYYVSLPENLEFIDEFAFEICKKLYLIDNASSLSLTPGKNEHGGVASYAKNISTSSSALPERTDEGLLFIRDDDGKYLLISCDEEQIEMSLPEKYLNEEYSVCPTLFTDYAKCMSLTVPDNIYYDLNGWEKPCVYRQGEESRTIIDENGLVYTYNKEDNSVIVLGCTDEATSIVIDFPDADRVTVIADAFSMNTRIISAKIVGDVSLSEGAFRSCPILKEVCVSGRVFVGSYCFEGCRELENVDLGEESSVDSNNFSEVSGIFENCISLVSVRLSDSTETLPYNCFRNCISLERIEIGSSLKKIESECFGNCISINEVVFGGSLDSWAAIAMDDLTCSPFNKNGFASLFIQNKKLTEAHFGEDLTAIGQYTFFNYRSLKSVSFSADSVFIGKEAFYRCEGLERIDGLDRAEQIDDAAFGYCISLKELNFGNGISRIGDVAFEGCTGITEVILPHSLTRLGSSVFEDCENLRKVTMAEGWKGRTSRIIGERISPEVILVSDKE